MIKNNSSEIFEHWKKKISIDKQKMRGENTMKSIDCPDCDTKLLYIKGSLACPVCGRDGKEIIRKQTLRLRACFLIPIIIFTLIYFGIRMKLYEIQPLIIRNLVISTGLSCFGSLIIMSSFGEDITKRNSKVLFVFSILILIAALFFLIKFLYLFFFTEWRPIRLF